MLSPRTALAVAAYGSARLGTFFKPDNIVPSYTVVEQRFDGSTRSLKFVEIDEQRWTAPRLRRSCTVLDVIILWTIAKCDDGFFLCTAEVDAHAHEASLFKTPRHVYVPVPFDASLARWLKCPLEYKTPGIFVDWQIRQIYGKYDSVARPTTGPVPRLQKLA